MAHQPARLITPRGKKIELSDDIYKQIKLLLTTRPRRHSRAKINAAIRATYGAFAGGASLTEALIAERRAERARENSKLDRLYGN